MDLLLYIQKQALQVDTCGAFFDILGLMLLILALLILFNRTDLIESVISYLQKNFHKIHITDIY